VGSVGAPANEHAQRRRASLWRVREPREPSGASRESGAVHVDATKPHAGKQSLHVTTQAGMRHHADIIRETRGVQLLPRKRYGRFLVWLSAIPPASHWNLTATYRWESPAVPKDSSHRGSRRAILGLDFVFAVLRCSRTQVRSVGGGPAHLVLAKASPEPKLARRPAEMMDDEGPAGSVPATRRKATPRNADTVFREPRGERYELCSPAK